VGQRLWAGADALASRPLRRTGPERERTVFHGAASLIHDHGIFRGPSCIMARLPCVLGCDASCSAQSSTGSATRTVWSRSPSRLWLAMVQAGYGWLWSKPAMVGYGPSRLWLATVQAGYGWLWSKQAMVGYGPSRLWLAMVPAGYGWLRSKPAMAASPITPSGSR
jgi:hypothetical protein